MAEITASYPSDRYLKSSNVSVEVNAVPVLKPLIFQVCKATSDDFRDVGRNLHVILQDQHMRQPALKQMPERLAMAEPATDLTARERPVMAQDRLPFVIEFPTFDRPASPIDSRNAFVANVGLCQVSHHGSQPFVTAIEIYNVCSHRTDHFRQIQFQCALASTDDPTCPGWPAL